jgi:signal transduction histidine kinase
MTTLVGWVPRFLRTAFDGGPAGQRRVVLLAFVCLGPMSSVVAAVLTGGGHPLQLAVRGVVMVVAIVWLLLRRQLTAAEWVALWTLLSASWVLAQLTVGPSYNGVFALNGLAMLTLVCIVFETPLVAYVACLGIAGYAWVQFDSHPAGRAVAAVVMFATAGSLLVLIVHGTASFLRDSLRDLGLLHARMEHAADNERARIAGELHDDTVQVLTAIGIRMDTMINRLERDQPGESAAAAQDVRQMVRDATDRTRRLSFNLYPAQLDHLGLGPALDALGDDLGRRDAPFAVLVSVSGTRYPPEVERLAYRTIRELLLNAHKHARARRVRVSVKPAAGAVHCEVKDDGRGFDASALAAARADFHTGLDATANRVRMRGGSFEIASAPRLGTRARFTIPLQMSQSRQAAG